MVKTFTKAALIAVIGGGLNLAVVAPAQAQVSDVANGRRCSFASVTDPTIENGEVQTGQINGGPLAAAAAGATISMKCTIQVGSSNSTHAGADSCAVASAASLQVTAVPVTTCSYLSPEGQPVYMCTQVTINGVTYYWDATVVNPGPPEVAAGWTTSNTALCNEAISQEIFPGPFEPILLALDELVCPIFESVWDGSALDTWPFRVGPTTGDDPRPDDPNTLAPNDGYNDLYLDTNGDGTITEDEWFWDCRPYRV